MALSDTEAIGLALLEAMTASWLELELKDEPLNRDAQVDRAVLDSALPVSSATDWRSGTRPQSTSMITGARARTLPTDGSMHEPAGEGETRLLAAGVLCSGRPTVHDGPL